MIPFLKMHGLGNDFVVLDNRGGDVPVLDWAKLADRHRGIGCDQIVLLEPSQKANIRARFINADGGEVESCGNASRCVACLISREKPGVRAGRTVVIETLGGLVEAYVLDAERITIDMGIPRLGWKEIPLSEERDTLHLKIENGALRDPVGVSMGNPHAVFFVKDVYAVQLDQLGPELERHTLFPARANISVAHIDSRERITARVWERGAGLTLACGTGACAILVAAHLRGLTGRAARVRLPGGTLAIEWREEDAHVLMNGPASISFKGEIDPEKYAA